MTTEEIIELAIQGHASTRDAIRWAIKQERKECAKVCDVLAVDPEYASQITKLAAMAIRARGEK